MNLQGDQGGREGQFHILPDFEHSLQLYPYSHHQTTIHIIESIPIPNCFCTSRLSLLQGEGLKPVKVAQLHPKDGLLLDVAHFHQYLPSFVPLEYHIRGLFLLLTVQKVLFLSDRYEMSFLMSAVTLVEESRAGLDKFYIFDVGQPLVVFYLCDAGEAHLVAGLLGSLLMDVEPDYTLLLRDGTVEELTLIHYNSKIVLSIKLVEDRKGKKGQETDICCEVREGCL